MALLWTIRIYTTTTFPMTEMIALVYSSLTLLSSPSSLLPPFPSSHRPGNGLHVVVVPKSASYLLSPDL